MVVCSASDFLALQSEFAKHFSALQVTGKTVSTVLTHSVCTQLSTCSVMTIINSHTSSTFFPKCTTDCDF